VLDLALQRLALSGYSKARVMRPSGQLTRAPRVSVVVPCYNYGRFLDACVASVLSQAHVDVDVLIVDDASPDGSGEVAAAIASSDPRVRVHRNPTNQGHIATYNIGFSQVDGEYVLLLSADDMLAPGALSRAVRLMESHPSVGFVYGWSIEFSDDGLLPSARTRTRSWSVWNGMDWLEDNCRRGTNVIRSSDAVIRRSVIERVGGYREDLPHSGDHEWWMRAAQAADVGMVGGVDQLYYRVHGANMSRTTYASALTNLYETKKAFDAGLDGSVGGDPVRLDALLRTAYAALARKALWLAVWEYMTGPDGDRSTAAYREFALEVDAAIADSRSWRALQRREAAGLDRARRTPSFRARELVRDLQGRISWRRRRFSGV
jgi:glycosyltransferase involved in cell wall biosynthesis